MKKILLTSSGFETEQILKAFLGLFEKAPSDIKALFVPTAANAPDSDGIGVLPKCMNDLLKSGIPRKNISIFDLHCNMSFEELKAYDVIYFTGGSPQYLIQRINDTEFNVSLHQYIDNGGVYVGVSAGSLVATNDVPQSLGLVNCTLGVHMPVGTESGEIDTSENPHINLSAENALLITNKKVEVIV
ncbi:MAG: Type 1 glutamine amidotransferase-like domain-containing protein [Oscillospiraceae bacterium]|jgi:dipeptidase E|nr:Type 1 glutamine amidotransferase-like domain-containing protein [Oscillospiraceae bacterium]